MGEVTAIDFETKGFPTEDNSEVVGIGLANSKGSWFIDVREVPLAYSWTIRELARYKIPLIAHNMNFDATWTFRDYPEYPLNWHACTYATYRLTATEGWPGQQWGLKAAQVEMLGWADSNEQELDQWLVDNGWGTKETNKETGQIKLKPDKGEMHRAPKDILGKYCALDADSTWQLYQLVLKPCLDRFQALKEYCLDMYPSYIRILIEQTLSGIQIDLHKLATYSVINQAQLESARRQIYRSPLLRKHLDRFNQEAIKEVADQEPERYLKQRVRPPEPPKFTKSGAPSKAWVRWEAQKDKYNTPVQSKNWEKWHQRWREAISLEHFNMNSYAQKKKLFYEMLFPESRLTTIERKQAERLVKEPVWLLSMENGRKVFLPLTKSGGTPVDRKAIRCMGDVGKLFLTFSDLQKEQQFIEALKDNHQGGILHPQFRVPGTLSGRLSGGSVKRKDKKGFNIQQVPKSPGFLRCFVPRSGRVWVDVDHTALEQVVLAELSKDKTLWELYGPGFNLSDVKLALKERKIPYSITEGELVIDDAYLQNL